MLIGIKDPILADSCLFVDGPFLDVVSSNAVRADDLDGQHGRAVDKAALTAVQEFLGHESNVGFGAAFLVDTVSNPRRVDFPEVSRRDEPTQDHRQPGQKFGGFCVVGRCQVDCSVQQISFLTVGDTLEEFLEGVVSFAHGKAVHDLASTMPALPASFTTSTLPIFKRLDKRPQACPGRSWARCAN